MSSTTTSESSASSCSETEDVTPHQDEGWITKKRHRSEDDEPVTGKKRKLNSPATTVDVTEDGDEKPKKKRAPMRRLEIPPFHGHILNIVGMDDVQVKIIVEDLNNPVFQKEFPDTKCTLIPLSEVKRLPSEEKKREFNQETKRLAKERNNGEAKARRELTPAEKEARRLRNEDPVYKEEKKIRAKLKRETFNANPDNKKLYKEKVKEIIGVKERKKTPRKKTVIETEEVTK